MAAKKVLLVDDEAELRELVSFALCQGGFEIAEAENGEEALRYLQAATSLPDIILSDMQMPKMDGMTFLSRLSEQPQLAQIPVVIVTAYGNDGHQSKAKALGARGYITKPFEFSSIARRVEDFLPKS